MKTIKTTTGLKAGAQATGEPAYLVIGKLLRPHGIKGEMRLEVITDFPERIVPGKTVYVGDGYEAKVIASVRPIAAGLLIRFEGVGNPETAGAWRNTLIHVKTAELPKLPQGEFYLHQVMGFQVVAESGEVVGALAEIIETGANDVYLVKAAGSNQEILLPAIESVILEVDFERSLMKVRLPEWY